MSTINSKMTALADEVRELSGSIEPLSIDAMTTNIGNANDEVSTQADLINQIMTTVNELPTASSDSSHKYILHGSYTLSRNPTYDDFLLSGPIEIAFEYGMASSYFPEGEYMACATITKLYMDYYNRIEVHPTSIEGVDYGINYYDATIGAWLNSYYDFSDESYRIINIEKPIEVSKNVYELFMSLLRTDENTRQPYNVGYSTGYNIGWRACEEELGEGSEVFGTLSSLYVLNTLDCEVTINGIMCECYNYTPVPYNKDYPILNLAILSANENTKITMNVHYVSNPEEIYCGVSLYSFAVTDEGMGLAIGTLESVIPSEEEDAFVLIISE